MRKAQLEDVDILVEGNCALCLETETFALDPVTVKRGVMAVLSGEQHGEYRVLERDQRVIAQLMITYEWSDWRAAMMWWIQSVYVWPEYRGQGVFDELYQLVRQDAQSQGVQGLRLYVEKANDRALRVYQRVGMNGDHYRMFEDMFAEF
ncbi:MAG: GNAT family N-acetyltransferase [Myxococcales bacterium]|nr:GNAT family N-acetyltransferase [Myxococcales bacterium]